MKIHDKISFVLNFFVFCSLSRVYQLEDGNLHGQVNPGKDHPLRVTDPLRRNLTESTIALIPTRTLLIQKMMRWIRTN